MRKFFFCIVSLFVSITANAQRPAIDSVTSLKMKAAAAANAGDYAKAVGFAKQVIGMGAGDSSIYFLTAVGLALDGNKAEGTLYYDTALTMGYMPDPQTAIMLGFAPPHADVNYDSAFSAVHPEAVRAAKHLPNGYENRELYRIYQEDQGERMVMVQEGLGTFLHDTALVRRLVHNDSNRKKEIYSMLPHLKKSHSTGDLQEAGLILQHGNDTTDFWNAHELAMRAIQIGDTSSNARQLAAITLDRYLVTKGKPQRYGTQTFVNDTTGKLELYPVDSNVTDAERAKWSEPPLKDALKRANAVYGKKPG